MKKPIIVLLALSSAALLVSFATVGSKGTILLDFLPKDYRQVPHHAFFGTIAMISSIVGLAILGRSWERDELPMPFIEKMKFWGVATLLASSMPSMMFFTFLIEEVKRSH